MPQNLKSELAPGRFIISFRNRLMDFFYSYMSMVNDLAGGWGILMTSAYYPRVLRVKSVSYHFFSKTGHYIILIFGMKLHIDNRKNVTEPFFGQKF